MDSDVDWSLCVICQKFAFESLRCPKSGNASDAEKRQSYEKFIQAIKKLNDAGVELGPNLKLPLGITTETLWQNTAKWHKSCHLKFSPTHVDRMVSNKKKLDDEQAANQADNQPDSQIAKKPRTAPFDNTLCIFCQKSTQESLRAVSSISFGTDRKSGLEKWGIQK